MSKSKTHARLHDQFYTRRSVATRLASLARMHLPEIRNWVEPSAGDGAFVDAMSSIGCPVSAALDLHPARNDIAQADFLSWSPPPSMSGRIGMVGNPPFGKNASLAVKFFNHAAVFSDGLAMIFPRTFQKLGLQNRLDAHFELVFQEVLEPGAFVFEGQDVDVPCVFQVWRRLPEGALRPPHAIVRSHPDFTFVDRTRGDFAFQRVGVRAGAIKPVDAPVAEASHLFVRVTDRGLVDVLRTRFEQLDWSEFKHNTAGNPSIGKGEIVQAYSTAHPGS